MQSVKSQLAEILPRVTKPGRYVGNELHIIRKPWDGVEVSFALAFPDVYEIGMSHVGMQILYHVLNRPEGVAAERVYVPWPDMEAEMRRAAIPLYALESMRPVVEFDVLGVSLQYELQYTNVLTLLDLSGIPLRASQRDESHPLVIAGGPCALNPEPMADFLDAVVLGDGEEVVLEIAEALRAVKAAGGSRADRLQALSRIAGVYVPGFYEVQSGRAVPIHDGLPERVAARMVAELDPANYPEKPLVPQIEVTHDRFAVEIMRGCTRGCRFCNAGMTYRPLRTRKVDELLSHARSVIANTGHDELSLMSLSTSDYPHLPELLRRLRDWADSKDVSVSFPSLRSDSFTPELADLAKGLRRSGLTLAPEAGTQRLRDVINKNNTEEDLLRAASIAYERGWRHVKLYFMIGLPTETEADLEGLVDLVEKVVRAGKAHGKGDVHVSLSPFSPKPHTPFQWAAQDAPETLDAKVRFIKQRIRSRQVKLSWREPAISALEAALGRGDRRLAPVIEAAWRAGARFDAWSDTFDFDRWTAAFAQNGLRIEAYTGALDPEQPLPWSHLTKGVSERFLRLESERALSGTTTPDCREAGCQGCGLEAQPACQPRRKRAVSVPQPPSVEADPAFGREARKSAQKELIRKIRLLYEKGDAARFTSHLDTIRVFHRALRRANITVAMSQGFHAHPKIASGPPLSLGMTSQAEYMDLELMGRVPENLENALNPHLPEGFRVVESRWFFQNLDSLNSAINRQGYRVSWEGPLDEEVLAEAIDAFMKSNTHRIKRSKKGREVEVDIRLFVDELKLERGTLRLELIQNDQGTARVSEVLAALLPPHESPPKIWHIERVGQWIQSAGRKATPLEVI